MTAGHSYGQSIDPAKAVEKDGIDHSGMGGGCVVGCILDTLHSQFVPLVTTNGTLKENLSVTLIETNALLSASMPPTFTSDSSVIKCRLGAWSCLWFPLYTRSYDAKNPDLTSSSLSLRATLGAVPRGRQHVDVPDASLKRVPPFIHAERKLQEAPEPQPSTPPAYDSLLNHGNFFFPPSSPLPVPLSTWTLRW